MFVQFVTKNEDKKKSYTSNVAEFDLVMQVWFRLSCKEYYLAYEEKCFIICFLFFNLQLDSEIWNTWFRVLFKRRNLPSFRWIQVKFLGLYSINAVKLDTMLIMQDIQDQNFRFLADNCLEPQKLSFCMCIEYCHI